MSETLRVPATNQSSEQNEKYFNFQIKGWTNFDPMDKKFGEVAEGIEQGNGFLTLVEVLRVEEKLTSIDDEDAKECFENLLAAKRLIHNMNELSAKVKEELRAALKREEEVARNKIVTLAPAPSVNEGSAPRVKRW